MNDHYYKMICEFIPIHERKIINKNTYYIIGIKKKRKLIISSFIIKHKLFVNIANKHKNIRNIIIYSFINFLYIFYK